jgi:Tfp pilus assembly protein PilO
VIVLLGWFLVISPNRGRAAAASEELSQIQEKTASLQQKAASLKTQSEELDAKRNELQALSEKLPDDAGVAQILNQISSASARAGVTVNSFTPGAPTPLSAGVPAAPATTGTEGVEGETAAATPAPTAAPVSKLSYVPVTIAVEGTPSQVSAFVTNLENITRAMLITNLDLTSSAGEQGSTLSANIQGRIFMRPTGTGKASASPSPSAS